MSDDIKLVGAGGAVKITSMAKVLRSSNLLSFQIDEIIKSHLPSLEDELANGTPTEKRYARSFLVDMKKMTNEGIKLQNEVIKLDIEQRRAVIETKHSAITSIESRQNLEIATDVAAKILLRATDSHRRPDIIDVDKTTVETITETNPVLEIPELSSAPVGQ